LDTWRKTIWPATASGSIRRDELYTQATIVSPAKTVYVDAHATTAANQLQKAAVRLADVLNDIKATEGFKDGG
jgi:hypothetical protein